MLRRKWELRDEGGSLLFNVLFGSRELSESGEEEERQRLTGQKSPSVRLLLLQTVDKPNELRSNSGPFMLALVCGACLYVCGHPV